MGSLTTEPISYRTGFSPIASPNGNQGQQYLKYTTQLKIIPILLNLRAYIRGLRLDPGQSRYLEEPQTKKAWNQLNTDSRSFRTYSNYFNQVFLFVFDSNLDVAHLSGNDSFRRISGSSIRRTSLRSLHTSNRFDDILEHGQASRIQRR